MAKRAPAWADGNTERTIYFYRISIGRDGGGRHLPFPTAAVLAHLDGLPYQDRQLPGDRADAPVLFAWIDRDGEAGRMQLASIRREGLPDVERRGAISPLDIPDDAGLLEAIHVRFFRDNIVGVVYNFYGPRASRLAQYLRSVAVGVCPARVRLLPLLRHDVADRLDSFHQVKVVDLKVEAPFARRLTEANDSLSAALAATLEVEGLQRVEVILSAGGRRGDSLGGRLVRSIKRLARREDLSEGALKLRVKGRSDGGRWEVLDLLADDLLLKKRIALKNPRGRALDSDAAYAAIEEAHAELRETLRLASAADEDEILEE